jgi:hypothetical protein
MPDLQRLEWGTALERDDLPEREEDFLRRLGRPTLIEVPGADRTRTRVVTTLLHGNEPSGLRAMLRWLRTRGRPATDALLVIASVGAALTEPVFTHRARPGRRDLNRCFVGPSLDAEGALATAIHAAILDAGPECVVDIHNNTGHNPAYGVATRLADPELALVALFADRVVHAPLALGTLIEATAPRWPSVVVECGRSGDPVADEVAGRGLETLLERETLDLRRPERPMRLLDEPIRVCVGADVSLAFADAPVPTARLTISADIDRHNFEPLGAGAAIGWVAEGSAWPLEAWRTDGIECSREIFRLRGNVLETTFDFVPIMMTTRPDIAKSDCLFYAARDVGVAR